MVCLMQRALDKVQAWATENGLTLSPTKTNTVLCTRKRKIPDTNITLTINGNTINYVDTVKCLGITLDCRLNWTAHINEKVKQAKQYLHLLKTSISQTWGPTPEKMLWIWTAVTRPKITYASYIWATDLTKAQRAKLNKIQRLALMQLAHFRQTTPETGLDVILGQLPLDLHLLSLAILTHIRVKDKVPRGWRGKGPGAKGKPGHILRMELVLETLDLPVFDIDQIPKSKEWTQNYLVDPDLSGANVEDCLRLYTDGSKLDGHAGYGSVLLDSEDVAIREDYGGLGAYPTVFQAECLAIVNGLKTHNDVIIH